MLKQSSIADVVPSFSAKVGIMERRGEEMSRSIKAERYRKDSNNADLVFIVADEKGLSIECNNEKQSIDYSQLELQPAATWRS